MSAATEEMPDIENLGPEPDFDLGTADDSGKRTPRRPRMKSESKARPNPAPRRAPLKASLERFYATIGTSVAMFDPTCGTEIVRNAPQMAEAMDNLARENPNVRRVLERLTATSAWGTVIAAHAPVIMAITMHHVPAVREMMMPKPAGNPASETV